MHTNEAILAAPTAAAIKMIKENLGTSDKWVLRAVLVIYAAQTASEQATETTREENGVGFNGTDAGILSSFAQQILEFNAGKSRYPVALSSRQLGLARAKITKYAGQLLKVAREKAKAEAPKVTADGWDVLLEN